MVRLFCVAAAALFFVAAFVAPSGATVVRYEVSGVAPGDVLNIRAAPSSKAAIVGRIPPDGREIEIIGNAPSGWAYIAYGRAKGFVARRFLAASTSPPPEEVAANAPPVSLRCFGTEPFWSLAYGPRASQFETADGETASLAFGPLSASSSRLDTWMAVQASRSARARPLALFLHRSDACTDGMSGTKHPFEISFRLGDGRVLSGCCKAAP
jgi:uncharacterized membrane protein